MDRLRTIEWQTYGETVINPLALSFTLLMGFLILMLQRKYVIISMIAVACFITNMQRIVIANFDFNMLRIIILFCFIRIIVRSERYIKPFNIIDKLFIMWVLVKVVTHTMLWKTMGAFTYIMGSTYTALGLYFAFRFFLHEIDDIKIIIIALLIFSIPISISMFNEQLNQYNVFHIFGGVPKITFIREGRIRSQGAFSHPILAGSFGASLFPLAWGLLTQKERNYRTLAIVGIISSTVITITSSSSGPLLAYIAGILWLVLWIFRYHMRLIRFGVILLIIGLQLYMHNPIWHVLLRVSVVGGSTSWHRFYLIDQAIRRFNEWWLFGVKSTAHWGWGMQDVTNGYINEGVVGGVVPLLLFIIIIVMCFRTIIQSISKYKDLKTQKMFWSWDASYFTHAISFIGVSYFGQMMFFWYLPTAIIAFIRSYMLLNNEDEGLNTESPHFVT